ncbi:DUF4422 domain-containing protein [Nitratifractor sp.]
MKTKILVASHKPYRFPDNPIYYPIESGAALHPENFGILLDDSGIHISKKNPYYCELTALYWAVKNRFFDDVDYGGLVHYRRYFRGSALFDKFSILDQDDIETIFRDFDIILPKKRNYFIETIYSHYAHAHYPKDLDTVRTVIAERTPRYIESFDRIMSQKKAHMFNMFIMPRTLLYAYANWLFDILFTAEYLIDVSGYDAHQQRVFGFLAELLLNVWVDEKKLKIKEIPVVHLEGDPIVRKGLKLIGRKIRASYINRKNRR